jgi:hypothetical protein
MVRIEFSHLRLIEVLGSLFFPITAFELLDVLRKNDYRILVSTPPPVPPTHRAYVSGRVAEKKDCNVVVNSERRFIGVEGNLRENVGAVYHELIKLIENKFQIRIAEERAYLEFVGEGLIRTRKPAFKQIANAFKRVKVIDEAGKIFGEDVNVHSFSLVPRGKTPSSRDWFEFRIEPHIRLPTREYDFIIIQRSADAGKVIKFFKEVETKISGIIKLLERGG